LRRSLLRDEDDDQAAPSGVPQGVPDIMTLKWKDVQRELNNELHSRGLFSHEDVVRSQNGLTGAILAVLRRRLIGLYRQVDVDRKKR
jgi:hypothetical protein